MALNCSCWPWPLDSLRCHPNRPVGVSVWTSSVWGHPSTFCIVHSLYNSKTISMSEKWIINTYKRGQKIFRKNIDRKWLNMILFSVQNTNFIIVIMTNFVFAEASPTRLASLGIEGPVTFPQIPDWVVHSFELYFHFAKENISFFWNGKITVMIYSKITCVCLSNVYMCIISTKFWNLFS